VIVISDTTPLRYLTFLGMEELLPRLFGRVHCPDAVIRECLHASAPALLREWATRPPAWLVVADVPLIDGDLSRLDEGEAAAITLARQLSADVVLIDEQAGRRVAKSLGFTVAGTLNLLAQGGIRGWIDYAKATARLRVETNFRATDALVLAAWENASL
jgi:predicted nucleic acid-binding protein